MYSVYIIYSAKIDKYYIGFTSDINDRFLKHNRKSKGFSSLGRPWVLVYSESFDDKKMAMTREKQLKNRTLSVRFLSCKGITNESAKLIPLIFYHLSYHYFFGVNNGSVVNL
jgi:putative endonuclease